MCEKHSNNFKEREKTVELLFSIFVLVFLERLKLIELIQFAIPDIHISKRYVDCFVFV